MHSSDAVIAEQQHGAHGELKTRRIELISGLNLLEASDDVMEIAPIYIDRFVCAPLLGVSAAQATEKTDEREPE
ncbi:MAG: hypothetical protein J5I93_02835 [Pirellulaceae bacterium]|nr:hypothetical protein [Pirellulaceae bacterium]